MKINVVFFGTPELSVPFLSAIHKDADFHLVAVVTQPDKPSGRKGSITKPAVKIYAEEHGIPVLQFATLKSAEAKEQLSSLHADVFVVVVFGKLIPPVILQIPLHGCINVHPSLLPKYRGPSPFQEAILQGETETGVSIMLLDKGMDTGDILAQKKFAIDKEETGISIQTKICTVGVPLLVETIKQWIGKKIVSVPQNHAEATFSHLMNREDGKLNWNEPAIVLERKIRALQPWPGTWFTWKELGHDVLVKVHTATVGSKSDQPTGTVLVEGESVSVVCGDHTQLILNIIQPEGKNKMSAIQYIHGHKTIVKTCLD